MRRYLGWIVGGLAAIAFVIWLPQNITIVPIADVEAAALSAAFDAPTFVEGVWETRIIPTAESKAVDLAVVLNSMEVDAENKADKTQLAEVANQYGLITSGEANVYIVRGTGTVSEVNTEARTGTMTVALDGYEGPVQVQLYTGSRIPSDETSIRDAVGIQFGEFKEQTEYGKVGSEINRRIIDQVLTPLDKENLLGKQVEFLGAFGIRTFNLPTIDMSTISIVPLQLTVAE
jgi:predicted lipoprotein